MPHYDGLMLRGPLKEYLRKSRVFLKKVMLQTNYFIIFFQTADVANYY